MAALRSVNIHLLFSINIPLVSNWDKSSGSNEVN